MPVERTLFREEHDMFRDSVRKFVATEVLPYYSDWEDQGYVDRAVWNKAGEAGFLCPSMPVDYGGAGADILFSVVLMEELVRVGATGVGFFLHSDIVAPYILHYGSEHLKNSYLPKMATGAFVGAIAMTEPGAGSDLQSIRSTAIRNGDHYVLNGSKTFITNGWHCDVVVVAAKTDPSAGGKGLSLFVVDTSMEGFSKGKRLKKIGLKAQDTCELFFDNAKIPAENLLGAENEGFKYLMRELPWERLQIAITAVASAEAVYQDTLSYVNDRKIFGKAVVDFQINRHALAEIKTELQIARVFVDKCIELQRDGALDASSASMAKYWTTDLQCKVIDRCLQLHGGYGYMWDYPVARAWADARVQRIYGGTNEVMKELIARSL